MRDEREPNERPVAQVAAGRLRVGAGVLRVAADGGWDGEGVPPGTRGALVVLHGRLRNALDYLAAGRAALGGRDGWVVLAPQFLARVDAEAHGLPPDTLAWDLTGWMGGGPAETPAPVGAFAALDALLDRLGAAERVVLAGHSGGAQVVQRYALLGRGQAGPRRPPLRFVVANPSSYAFLDPWRPEPTDGCPEFDRWKYGLSGLPPLEDPPPGGEPLRERLARRYAARDVRYLLGGRDDDPAHPALDRSAPAMCQGPHRRARGEGFVAALRRRFPSCRHRLAVVPGVGHDAGAMFGSAEGAGALFD